MPTIVERLAADLQGVAHLPRLALRVGMLAGDLAADDDVRLSPVAGPEEPPFAVLAQRPREDGAAEVLVGDDVLAGDHRLVEDRRLLAR